jgi:uncharacterized protein
VTTLVTVENMAVSGDPLNYKLMTEDALRGVVRQALTIAGQRGLAGQHHFYLTFRTTHPGVQMPDHLRERHPEEMTIVLQHQFWGLDISPELFSVTLSFNGQHERLTVPFLAISAFVDPSEQFGLQFSVAEAEGGAVSALPGKSTARPLAPVPASDSDPAPAAAQAETDAEPARVVTLDSFRKSDARKK